MSPQPPLSVSYTHLCVCVCVHIQACTACMRCKLYVINFCSFCVIIYIILTTQYALLRTSSTVVYLDSVPLLLTRCHLHKACSVNFSAYNNMVITGSVNSKVICFVKSNENCRSPGSYRPYALCMYNSMHFSWAP